MTQLYAALIYCVGMCAGGTWHGQQIPALPPPDGLILYGSKSACEAHKIGLSASTTDGSKPPYKLVEYCARIYVDQALKDSLIAPLNQIQRDLSCLRPGINNGCVVR